ncbi:helix-turn-helix domain-containing protein [Streptomyces sp. NPDC005202]|uniref:helix-turn-helix domain-containing protein n=1 Tax=Streptomyces sp. NPDC005202 TaxID=3157021 RepID=UPI0033A1056E
MTEPHPAGAKTLDSGLRILWALREHPDGLGLAELARLLELDRNAVRRMLGALTRHRLVVRVEPTRYQLGLGLVELALAVQPRLREAAAAELRRLADAAGATAFVTALEGDDAVVVSVVEPTRSFAHVAYRAGLRHAADRGASGIAILAGRPPVAGERPEVTAARDRGYSMTRGELEPGTWGLAAPVTAGRLPAEASVGVVSIGELDEDRTAPEVLAAAATISALLPAAAR